VFRRSLYIAEDMSAGESFSPKNLRIIRPGLGLAPRYYERILGRKVARAVKRGTPVSWDLVSGGEGENA
jgi:N-acetylneuraminate synthase